MVRSCPRNPTAAPGEAVTPNMLGGCAVILMGTGLATGVLKLPAMRRA
jgi:hypothetical protein